MKWKLSRLEPAMPIYYLMKFIGLAPFTMNKDGFHPPTLLDKFYSVFVATGYFLIAVKAAETSASNIIEFKLARVAVIGTIIQTFISFPSTIFTTLLFLFKYKEILYIVNKLGITSKKLKSFGIVQDQEKFVKNSFIITMMTNAVLIPMLITVTVMNAYSRAMSDINYAVDHYVSVKTILIYVHTLLFIRQLFKQLNKKLYDVFRASGERRSLHHSGLFIVTGNHREDHGTEALTDLEHIRKIKVLHLELCNLLERTVQFFTIPILFRTFQSYIDLILQCFWIYFDFRYFGKDIYTKKINRLLMDLLLGFMRITLVIIQWIFATHASVKICQEGNAMRIVLSKVWYKFKPRKVEDEIFTFSLQLLHKPVIISVFGLLDMDYSYLYKMLGSTLAFVIVMVQFDKPEESCGA